MFLDLFKIQGRKIKAKLRNTEPDEQPTVLSTLDHPGMQNVCGQSFVEMVANGAKNLPTHPPDVPMISLWQFQLDLAQSEHVS